MPEEAKMAPPLRFQGFSDAWEQRKLEQLAQFNPKSSLPDKFEYVDLESVVGTEMISHRTETKENAPSRAQRLAIQGDVFYQTVRPYQKNNYLFDLPHNNYVFSTGYAQLRPFGDSYFLLSRLQDDKFVFNVLERSTGTSYPAINSSDLAQIEVGVPLVVEEQIKIGDFFKNLDNTIALHQRKSTLLKQLKQTYLKQIFPQNKENIPALRFAGFSEPWKQHKFDEVFSHVQNNSLSRADLNYNGGYAMNIHYGDILIRFGEYLDVSKCKLPMIANKQLVEKYKASFLKDGDIVIADAAEDETVGKCSELRGIEDANILAGLHTIPSRPNWTFAPGYLGYYMNSSAFHDQLLPLIQGTKISSISKSALKKTDIKYPYGKDEQTKIGNLFKQLDDSISLHQSKLEKLTDLKQVLLAKMFV